ncbi:hypothetical protein R6Z07F_008009 [Ovis aries]
MISLDSEWRETGQDSRGRPLAPRGPPERKGAVGLSGLLSAAPPSGGLRAADPGCAARERRLAAPAAPILRESPRSPGGARGPSPKAARAGRARGCSCFCAPAEAGAAPRTQALAGAGLPGVWRLRLASGTLCVATGTAPLTPWLGSGLRNSLSRDVGLWSLFSPGPQAAPRRRRTERTSGMDGLFLSSFANLQQLDNAPH